MSLQVYTAADLLPGDIGFASIKGRVGAGVLAGQAALDIAALLRGRRVENAGWITHAFVVTGMPAVDAGGPVPVAVEAMPSGARVIPIDDRIGPGYAYARLAMPMETRRAIAAAAVAMVDTPYGFGQYAAIAALTLSGGDNASPSGPLARWVARRGPDGRPRRAICSQLADESYRAAGVHLFNDGRPPAYVTPGSLFWRAAQLGEICIC